MILIYIADVQGPNHAENAVTEKRRSHARHILMNTLRQSKLLGFGLRIFHASVIQGNQTFRQAILDLP